jgi:hypothetical protein
MSTPYNPGDSKDNCGFCAIAHGLYLQNPAVVVTADQLYLDTLQRLGLTREENKDPIPRMLIFPEPMLDSKRVSVAYDALLHRAHGLSSYTITSVAEATDLRFKGANDLSLVRQFMQGFSNKTWTMKDFLQVRWDILKSQGRNPSFQGLERQIAGELVGHSIVGSKTKNHFINVHIDPSGSITAFDAQDGNRYDGRGLNYRLGTVDLFMRLLL